MKKLNILLLILCLFVPFTFIGCENSNINTLATPENFEVKNGVIIFDQVQDAQYYYISINDMELVLDVNYNSNTQIIDNKINYNANKIFNIGHSYAIKIKAVAEDKNDSSYTKTISYFHNAIVNIPENVQINGTTLTWDLVKNASYYLVKILTPDITGIQDDSESIANADLPAYTFNSNSFPFSSILNKAGNYKFYVNAVCSDGVSYSQSGYTSKVVYKHTQQLATPTCGEIKKDGNDLFLYTVIDENANAIIVNCDGVEKEVELNGVNPSIVQTGKLLKINLSKYFNNNFEDAKQYEFSVKAKNLNPGESTAFYFDSAYSKAVIYEKTTKLPTPELSLSFNNAHKCYEVTWNYNEDYLPYVTNFNLYVISSSTENKFVVSKDTFSSLIENNNFYGIAIQAVGSGNISNSALSNFVYKNDVNASINSVTTTTSTTSTNPLIQWAVQHATFTDVKYVVEFNDSVSVLTTNNYYLNKEEIIDSNCNIKLSILSPDYAPYSTTVNLIYEPDLAKPNVSSQYGYGFSSSNPYVLTFGKVENALGYYIYYKKSGSTGFTKIDSLYTANTIDLTQHLLDSSSYELYVQAFADPNSVYTSSNSAVLYTNFIRKLNTPTELQVVKETSGGISEYYLTFTGVYNAHCYEILINDNVLPQISSSTSIGLNKFKCKITDYLSFANLYDIKVRALPNPNAQIVSSSDTASIQYTVRKQLDLVENIKVTEHNGKFTLSFNPVENAKNYKVRIVKLGDNNYSNYLAELSLDNPFEIDMATDITNYLIQQGEYYVYMTALPRENSYYVSSSESTSFATVTKLESLTTPSNISFNNADKDNYQLIWDGDENADFYLIKITDPYGFSYELKEYNVNTTNITKNINDFMTVEGSYKIQIYSMIDAGSENSNYYTSSSYTEVEHTYYYTSYKDFVRTPIYYYGNYYDYAISNVKELQHVLWYNYLYEIDTTNKMPIYIEQRSGEDVKTAIIRLATEASNLNLYNFNEDEDWNNYISQSQKTNSDLLKYLSQRLLELYPDLHILSDVSVYSTSTNTFEIYYYNMLKGEKVKNTENTSTNKDYVGYYSYLDEIKRRSSSYKFAIDYLENTMLVETTEQLLNAVQSGKKPNFYNECETAEKVYNNAKAVLNSIITNNMTDLQKATAIFDWLSHSYNLNVNATQITNPEINENDYFSTYAKRQEFYLEGIFLNILDSSNGAFDGEFYLGNRMATEYSYSKAFSLLCNIEGIKTTTVYGTRTVGNEGEQVNHVWNKIYLSTTSDLNNKAWYNVDVTYSDNNQDDLLVSTASHQYFLVTDSYLSYQLKTTENSWIVSQDYSSNLQATTSYNYYANSTFGLTKTEIESVAKNLTFRNYDSFIYSKEFSRHNTYQNYDEQSLSGAHQSFILNVLMYAKHIRNDNNLSCFEFSFDWKNNNKEGSNLVGDWNINSIIDTANSSFLLNVSNSNIKTISDDISLENGKTVIILTFEFND